MVATKRQGKRPLATREKTQEDITSLVKVLLARRGPSKGELAEMLGMPASSLTHSLGDSERRRYWQPHEVLALSKYYEVSVDAFLGDPEARAEVRADLRDALLDELDVEKF